MKLKDLAAKIGVELTGAGDVEISGAAGVHEAKEGSVTFIVGTNYLRELEKSGASAAIVPPDTPEMRIPLLRVKNPRFAFAQTLEILYNKPYRAMGISEKAVIGRNVILGADLSIHPFAVVSDDAKIGNRVTLYPGVYVGRGSAIGNDCVVYSNVSIREGVTIGSRVIIHPGAVIGSDGYGFVTEAGEHHKIPQVGGVIIEDDVEVGANCTIDRATLGNTIIKKGAKLDNLIQVAHNVTIGEHCLLAAQVGIAGSSTLGSYVVLGGQVGISDHITISDRVIASAQSGIIKDPGLGQVVGGTYAMPHREWLKVQAVLPKLPELKRLVTEIEKQIRHLKEKLQDT